MISVQDWKTAKCADTKDTDHTKAIEALTSLLEGDTFPSDAAKAITKTYEASLKVFRRPWKDPHRYHNKVTEFWVLYMSNAIRSFGSAEEHERLFELLVEISRQPDLEDDDGMVVKSIDHKTFWVDLPGWAYEAENSASCMSISQSVLLLANET